MLKRILIQIGFLLWISGMVNTQPIKHFYFNQGEGTEFSNLHNINRLFSEMESIPEKDLDYYFVVIGDTRNSVWSYDLSGFNYIAKEILFARDPKSNQPIFEKLKFIIHSGDFVYNGAKKSQWQNLKKAFSLEDSGDNDYSYLKLLISQKPLFPILGNHEIMRFRLKGQTDFKGLVNSARGVVHFKDFFNWSQWRYNPNLMVPIPSTLSQDEFTSICNGLSPPEQDRFKKHYIPNKKHNYQLQLIQDLIDTYRMNNPKPRQSPEEWFEQKQEAVISDLLPLYQKVGYPVLPVLSTDDMICYAFEFRGIVFLILDSIARGWHYPNFSRLKQILNRSKRYRHELHLFSASLLNGQYGFYRAVYAYARENDKLIIPMFHLSPLCGTVKIDHIDQRLMLGTQPHPSSFDINLAYPEKPGTILDHIIFEDESDDSRTIIPTIFSSDVHSYEHFTMDVQSQNSLKKQLQWFITGGGGAELARRIDIKQLRKIEAQYNDKLKDDYPDNRAVKINMHSYQLSHNFLIVHVRENRIIDVHPHMVAREKVNIRSKKLLKGVKCSLASVSNPASTGLSLEAIFAQINLRKFGWAFEILAWEPALSVGFLGYDLNRSAGSEITGLVSLDPLRFTLNFPRSKYTILLGGVSHMLVTDHPNPSFFTWGISAPLLNNFFNFGPRWSFFLKFYTPFKNYESVFPGKKTRTSLGITYNL